VNIKTQLPVTSVDISAMYADFYMKFYGYIDPSVCIPRCSAIAEKVRCRVHWFWPNVEDWKTIFNGHNRSIFNYCDIIGLKAIEFVR